MTTWRIIEHHQPDRLTVRYMADDGVRSILMVDMFWDRVTPLEDWLGRVDPWPDAPLEKELSAPMVGLTGTCGPMNRTPPLTQEEIDAMRLTAPRDPLTAV
jgi:hypothetical protein